jgi:DNA sulfur modification protein DndB
MSVPQFVFPAVKGIQANKEYYISMVPLATIPKLFQFSDDDLPAEVRAQRVLNKARIPEMRNYIVMNTNSYVFSSLTASVDGDILFKSINEENPYNGEITIPMSARFLINDGQHRCAAIEEALKKKPDLKYEHISVVFYHDLGLKRSQQMFSDLNRYAIRPTKSLNILFDNRDEFSLLVKKIVDRVDVFGPLVDKERTTISNRSIALFTLNAIYNGTEGLLKGLDITEDQKLTLAVEFWNRIAQNIPEWQNVKKGNIKSSEIRKNCVCSLSITIVAFGIAGNKVLREHFDNWKSCIDKIANVNWSKSNQSWESTVVVNGNVVASRATQQALVEYFEKIFIE